jgi:uncharacterized protein (DUF1330 family)
MPLFASRVVAGLYGSGRIVVAYCTLIIDSRFFPIMNFFCLLLIAYLRLNIRYKKSKHMSAFVIVEVTIRDHKEYEEYKKLTPASIEAYGGRFIIRGAKTETLEGEWNPERIVVLEFATVARAKEWWEFSRVLES